MALKSVSPDFFEALLAYDWPGNVRELIQALEKAVLEARDELVLIPRHLPEHIRIRLARTSVTRVQAAPAPVRHPLSEAGPVSLAAFRQSALDRIEAEYLADLMRRTGGDIGEACRISGLSRSRLYALLKKRQVPSG
jgi:transcriptional regulator of acetoin/glycerol metabolism